MKTTALLVLILFASPLTCWGAVIQFDQLQTLVRDKNENVQAAQSTLKAEQARSGYFVRSFLPSVNARIGSEEYKANPNPKVQKSFWGIEGNVNLFRGGRDYLEGQIRREKSLLAGAELENEYANELREAQKSYWGLVAVNQLLDQMKEASSGNERNLQAAKRRAGAGVATTGDTLQFGLHSTLVRQEIKKLELQRDLLRNRLSVALGMDEHENIEVVKNFPHPPDHAILPGEMIAAKNAGIQELKARENVAILEKSKANRWWLPSVDAYAGYRLPSLSDEYTHALRREKEVVAGVVLSLSLSEGIESFTEGSAKSYEAEAQKRRASHRLREVVAADHEIRHDIKLLHDLIHDADKDAEKAQRFLKITEMEYSRGVKNGPDMLGAYQRYFEFLKRRTDLYREFHEAQADLAALLAQAKE